MTSFLTGALGDYLGDAVAAAVGIEHTAAEFSERAEAAFKRADADGSATKRVTRAARRRAVRSAIEEALEEKMDSGSF